MKDKPADRDVDRMRELLARTPPADQALAGRANEVVARARRSRTRQRRGVIGGIAVAAVAAAVIVTPHFLKTSPTTNEATDPDNGANVVAAGSTFQVDPCPVDPVDVTKPDAVESLPADPASVRLCTAQMDVPGQDEKATSWFLAPADALITETEDFVAAVADAPPFDSDECAAIDYVSSPFALVVTGQDGRSVVLGGPAPICNAVTIGNQQVSTDWLTATFMDALERQREAVGAPAKPPLPGCPDDPERAYSTFVNEGPTVFDDVDEKPSQPVAGVVCPNPIGPGDVAGGVLDDEQVTGLAADIDANSGTEDGDCSARGVGEVGALLLIDAWGDVTAWTATGCEGGLQHGGTFWSPSPDSEALLSAASGGHTAE